MFDTYNVQLTREPSPMLVEGLRACIRPESASKFRQVFATCRDLETLGESCYFDFISVARVEPIRNRRGRILLIQASKQGPKLTQIFLKPPLGIVLSVRPFNCRPEGGRHAVTPKPCIGRSREFRATLPHRLHQRAGRQPAMRVHGSSSDKSRL